MTQLCLFDISLCDIFQCNIIKLIFVKDSNHLLFEFARWQQLVPQFRTLTA